MKILHFCCLFDLNKLKFRYFCCECCGNLNLPPTYNSGSNPYRVYNFPLSWTELLRRGKVITVTSYKINNPDFKLFSLQQSKSNKATVLAKRKSKSRQNSFEEKQRNDFSKPCQHQKSHNFHFRKILIIRPSQMDVAPWMMILCPNFAANKICVLYDWRSWIRLTFMLMPLL